MQILGGLPTTADAGLLVGADTLDDAAVVRWPDGSAQGPWMVQTIDVITPVVDDPYVFGRIAATNALSDVYAMGGLPLVALVFAGMPTDVLDADTIRAIFAGGADAVAEAGAFIGGGHTVKDAEVKYGLAVTGRVEQARLTTNAAGRPGDALVLTKPLGTGILFGARDALTPAEHGAWTQSMTTLNAAAAAVAARFGVRCATDVTGFGLLGHAMQLARASGCAVTLAPDDAPTLPGVRPRLAAKLGGAAGRNAAYAAPDLPPSTALRLLADPQTSGGLLLAIPAADAPALQAALRDAGTLAADVVGHLEPGPPGGVRLA